MEQEEMLVKQQLPLFRTQQPEHDITSDTTRNTSTHYLTPDSTITNTLQMQQNMTLESTTKTLPTQLSTTSDNLQTQCYLTEQNMTLDKTRTTTHLQTFHDLTDSPPTFRKTMEETNNTGRANTLPHDWNNVGWTEKDVTLEAIYSKLEEVNKKVEKLICYFALPNKSILKRETHITTTVKKGYETGEKHEILSEIKQKAFAVTSNRGNFAKQLVSLVYTPEERLGWNCTRSSTSG